MLKGGEGLGLVLRWWSLALCAQGASSPSLGVGGNPSLCRRTDGPVLRCSLGLFPPFRLNLRVVISLTPTLESLSAGMKFALSGELFAKVPTPYNFSPDTDEGYLLSRSVPTAFLALDPPVDERVYEVIVEHKATTENTIWLQIPKRCCSELNFQPNTSHKVEIQFQIDQLLFRQWHQAVDRLMDEKLVLPDVASCSVPHSPGSPQKGNSKQKLAISFITGQATSSRQVPPLLIYGPFGTGKTFTLAMAAMEILRQPHKRVLICTHTNRLAVGEGRGNRSWEPGPSELVRCPPGGWTGARVDEVELSCPSCGMRLSYVFK